SMRRWHSMLTASLSALFAMISVQALSSIWYFSLNSLSQKIFSRFLAQSATNAAPTSELIETRTPRSVIASSGLATRAGLFGGGGSSRMKPASGFGLVVMLSSIADELGGRQRVVEAGRDPSRLSRHASATHFPR